MAAEATEQAANTIEEIIVTAQKRSENQQNVPISITTLTSDMIDRMHISTLSDLQGKAPNVIVTDGGVIPAAFIPTIRGVGDRAGDQLIDQPVLVVVDGVSFGGMLGADLDTFDIDAIEVLRGPQGTLQGRNATGGAINVRTRAPSLTEDEVRTSVDYGNFSTWTARAAIDGPIISNKLGLKFAAISTDSDGAYHNDFTGKRTGGAKNTMGRLSALYEPNDAFNINVIAAYAKDQSEQPPGREINTDIAYPRPQTGGQGISTICTLFNVCTPYPAGHNASGYTPSNWTDQGTLTAIVNWNMGPATLTSVSGYRRVKDSTNLDIDFLPIPFIQVENQLNVVNTWSQELRVASSDGGNWDANGKLKWVGGLYVYNNEFNAVLPVCLPALGVSCSSPPQRRGQNLDSYAAFAHGNYELTDQLQVFAGVRDTKDKKQFHEEAPTAQRVDASFSKVTSEIGAQFNFTKDKMVYAHFSQGYRAGGINPTGSTYAPETVNAVELGLKMSGYAHRLVLDGALFHYSYKDIQRGVVFPTTEAPFYQQGTANAASATIEGAETEIAVLPVPGLLLGLQVGYLDAHYDKYIDSKVNPDGSLTEVDDSALRLPNTPKWTFGSNADYTVYFPGTAVFSEMLMHADFSYKTNYNVHPADIPLGNQPSFGLINATLRFTTSSGRYSASIYGKNLANKYYITLADPVAGLTDYAIQGMPRTYGVQFTGKFNL
ncbi:MAG TPA: TonB-dependent receptor [Steroidobacteraceae bacterium]